MADYDKVRFPDKISINAVGGPGFLTSIATMQSGKESRRQWWEQERGRWRVSHFTRTPDGPQGWRNLLAFFRVIAQGMANTFRFKDWTDFTCASGEGFFVTATFGSPIGQQMVKRYTFYGLDGTPYTYDRVINKPVQGTIVTDASGLDYATGIAASGTTWYGEFDCWCRLNNDQADLQMRNKQGTDSDGNPVLLAGWDGIELIEVIEEET